MPLLFVLIGAYLVAVLVVLPFWITVKLIRHHDEIEILDKRLARQEDELRSLRATLRGTASLAPSGPVEAPPPRVLGPTTQSPARPPVPARGPELTALGAPPPGVGQAKALFQRTMAKVLVASPKAPPPLPVPSAGSRVQPMPGKAPARPAIDWEQFMGAKLFAWLGGLALFLGVAFFVKYSFEHDLVPPQVRVTVGFLIGISLVVGGLRISRAKYRITAQTLIAAGVVSLYAVTFACNSIYHFALFGPIATFLVMTLITVAAFMLAVQLNAQVVAILGILGGFLTPVLINTGQDNPIGLFGYIALLVIGLVAVALRRSWLYLIPLGAAGSIAMLFAWVGKFYVPADTGTAMVVCLGFCALFLGAVLVARRLGRDSILVGWTAMALPAAAFGLAFYLLDFPEVADRTGLYFTFVLLTSLFAVALAWTERRGALIAAAAGLSALILVRWAAGNVAAEGAHVIVNVCLLFSGVYFLVYCAARRLGRATPTVLWSAVGLPAVSLAFALFLLKRASVGARPGALFGLIFASDALLLAVAWLDERMARLPGAAGLAVFALLSVWTAEYLTDEWLPWALGAVILFAALHTAFPLLLERRRPARAPAWWNQLFPPLGLLLMLVPIFRFETVSVLIWPAILLIDLIAIGLAALTASLTAVAAVLLLTLVATGMSVFQVPAEAMFEPSLLVVIGGFVIVFFFGGLWLVRQLGRKLPPIDPRLTGFFGNVQSQVPALASLLPFLLLIIVCGRLGVPDPSAVFGLGLLLVFLTLGLARLLVADWLPACALGGMAALEFVWHVRHFSPSAPGLPLAWYWGFYMLFAAYPFVFRARFSRQTGPWAMAALSGVAHFWMVYQAIKLGWAIRMLGLVPAVFALAPLASLIATVRKSPADNPRRLDQLAWFGGVTLFFVTLIFPIQLDRQWLTVAWSLEGAALLWLFHRVPHPGLRATGVAILGVAFVRLALNPAVLGYHVRGDWAVFNWYLYTYGLAIGSMFLAVRLLASPRKMVLGVNAQALAFAWGVILLFLLLNIEIADYFTPPGTATLTFQFSGNFARDMGYTIGWALFALGLLSTGIWRQERTVRYAGIALLSVALLKLFFHDLARLEALYRIGALFAVAVIAILASFAYQRFLPSDEKPLLPKS